MFTDHKPLTFSFSSQPDRHTPRQIRHLDYISQFTTDIRHVKNKHNPVADAFSRLGAIHSDRNSPINFEEIAAAQQDDPALARLQASSTSLKLQPTPLSTSDGTIICDVSTGVPRPYVADKFCHVIFDSLHSLSHPSIRATQRLITSRYVWPSINADVRKWTRSCLPCQQSKIQRHTRAPPATFATPDARFDQVHIDLVGPLPPSNGFNYLLTCIDRFTRWPEAIPLVEVDITAESVARAFIGGWIARFGVPSTVTTDRGRQFESALWHQLMQLLGCKRLRTTSYHPIANGLIERFHRHLKASLKAYHNPIHWTDSLPMVLLGVRTQLKEDLQCTTAELVYGTTLRLPGEFFDVNKMDATSDPASYVTRLKQVMRHLKASPVHQQKLTNTYVSPDLQSCTHVFVRHDVVRKSLQQPYNGPYKVLMCTDKYFLLDINGRQDTVSLDRLKPAFQETLTSTTECPRQSLTDITKATQDHPPITTTVVTRSGRQVRWPKRLSATFIYSLEGSSVADHVIKKLFLPKLNFN